MNPIKLGIGVASIGRFLPFIAQASGLFEREKLVIEIVNQRDEERAVPDIVSGATPIGTPNAPSLIFSVLGGSDLVIVAGLLNRPAFFLAADPAITRISDLKGKRVGINEPKRMAGMVMLALLRKWGLEIGGDLNVVDSGINDRSYEALLEKKIDAALLPPEKAFLAEALGFRVIADSLELDCHWVPLATTRRFLQEHRELARKIVAIYAESVRLFKKRPQETMQEISRRLPALAEHPQVVEKCYTLFAREFESSVMPSMNSLSAILREVARQDPRAAEIEPASLVENLL
ncbi:MAG TPA: ABC transporter substrate-binding protein [Candidatus Binatia bacterium]|nr:ABC transporter substrate-binding protein [Candidatus Binatia bacterium]